MAKLRQVPPSSIRDPDFQPSETQEVIGETQSTLRGCSEDAIPHIYRSHPKSKVRFNSATGSVAIGLELLKLVGQLRRGNRVIQADARRRFIASKSLRGAIPSTRSRWLINIAVDARHNAASLVAAANALVDRGWRRPAQAQGCKPSGIRIAAALVRTSRCREE